MAIHILILISLWKIFEKAGLAGWKSIIPFYNIYCLVVVAKLPWWYFLLIFIPYLGLLVAIYVCYKIALAFGKSGFYTIGLMLLPIIFFPLLAFGDAEYDFSGVEVEETSNDTTLDGPVPRKEPLPQSQVAADSVETRSEGPSVPQAV